jgi:hypothetical protein
MKDVMITVRREGIIGSMRFEKCLAISINGISMLKMVRE